ncbi:MAG: transposase, partial [Moraxellaceae bacterium]|nr:transposase [Moraxellaceae bacterium]
KFLHNAGERSEEITIYGKPDFCHLNEGESGMAVAEICRKHGVSQPTYCQWKSKYTGVSVSEFKRMLELEIAVLKNVLGKKL